MKLIMQLGSVPDEPIRFDDVSMFIMTMDDGTPIAFGAETAAHKTIIWSVPDNDDFWEQLLLHKIPQICARKGIDLPSRIRRKKMGDE